MQLDRTVVYVKRAFAFFHILPSLYFRIPSEGFLAAQAVGVERSKF